MCCNVLKYGNSNNSAPSKKRLKTFKAETINQIKIYRKSASS